jgi:ferredoxin/flavodoxin---NADP+ reductase
VETKSELKLEGKMYKIVKKEVLNPTVVLMDIEAPHIARKAEPGQFIILRISETGERIPLTIADVDREKGTVTIIYQLVGKTTTALAEMNEGDYLQDFVGPLGTASHLEGYKKVAVIGGGLGTAIAYPQAKKLHALGAEVHVITGFRNKDLIILEEDMKKASDKLIVATDDGSNGNKGFVTNVLKQLIDEGNNYDLVIAIGPLVMMRAVSNLTKEYGIKTLVSMNPVMIDGTGMCGGCRLTVGGKTKFACVDGPDFDAHEVDFDEAMRRQGMYKKQEKESTDIHICNLGGATNA